MRTMQTTATTSLLFIFITILIIFITHSTKTTPPTTRYIINRRTLHSQGPQPLINFFPSSPYSLPPSQPPKPSLPKFPSSSSTTSPPLSTLSFHPFFPFYPSPPPPFTPTPTSTTTTTLPTFPANFSSSSSSRHKSSSKLLISIAIPILSIAVLFLIILLFLALRRRNRRSDDLFPTQNAPKNIPGDVAGATSGTGAGAGVAASEFLYLGTLASSRAAPAPATERTAESPELRPLPPLPRQHRVVDEEEDYYSPKDSPSGSKVDRSRSSTTSSVSGQSSTSPTKIPTQLIRPPTPSPPKRRPASHSQSPPEFDVGIGRGSGKGNWGVPQRIGEFANSRGPREVDAGIGRGACEGSRGVPQRIGEFASTRGPPLPPPPPPAMGGSRPKGVSLMPPALSPPKPLVRNSASVKNSNGDMSEENVRPKLKPLHWDKVRASSDRAMVWDQLKSGSFQLDEEMIETLFGREAVRLLPKELVGRQINGELNQEDEVLDPRKAQNIAIMLRALNVDKEEVCEALREGDAARLGNELLEALTRMIPSKEEELKLKEWRDDSPFKLGLAEGFLKAVIDIPFAFKRVDAMLYIVNFDSEVDHLRNLFETLEVACEELRNNRIFHKILGAVLKTGNRMNVGTNRGDARAFKLDTLLKLVDVKGTDGKTTLLHFVIQEIIRAEGSRLYLPETARPNAHADHEYRKLGLQVVSALGTELSNVKKAAAMDSDMLTVCVLKLAGGISIVREVVRLNNMNNTLIDETSQKFHDAMIGFLIKAENTILEIQNQESNALYLVKETTQYFHGDSAKEEAHPFRIFVVVRDFLVTLDHVCKEVEKTKESTLPNMSHWLPASMNQTSFSALPGFNASKLVTFDDENSSSS